MGRFGKVLVANRGEIAARVLRTCRALGYRTVGVYSDADRDAPHVSAADEAVHLGPAPARESYLAIEKVIAAAKHCRADAIHPGYGFLSENEHFARACAEAGIVFIGPPAEAVALMGNKRQAKLRMIAAGVPCIPGYEGPEQSDEALAREAERIGMPVMVKAAAGGGGRGMRLVEHAGHLVEALRSARSEAQNAFGSGELILERAVVHARHVEVQVFADEHGNAVHLGERDCSVQRRHQKVIEEAPSPAVDPALRERMGAVAVAAAKAIGYRGAGTIEFLLAPSGEFYFMEMNTRLQVEHPVTEMITGLDLVAWQLRVAEGAALPVTQDQVRFAGHAIEVRLCAEDPAQNFLPQTGTLLRWRVPAGEGVRVDHGVREGQQVSPFYDSMLAKVIAHGPDRESARRRLRGALRELSMLGVASNKDLLDAALAHEAFASGRYDTGFVPAHFDPAARAALARPSHPQLALAAVALYHADALALRERAGLAPAALNWSSAGPSLVPVRLASGDREVEAGVLPRGAASYDVRVAGASIAITDVALAGSELTFERDGARRRAQIARAGARLYLQSDEGTHAFDDVTLRPPRVADEGGDGRIVAPMDGKVLRVEASVGQRVHKGQLLVVLEAMKMEFQLVADMDGLVASVDAVAGKQVRARSLLVALRGA